MFFNSKKNKVKKALGLGNHIYFYNNEFDLYVNYRTFINHIKKSEDIYKEETTVLEYFIPFINAHFEQLRNDPFVSNKIVELHQTLISNGVFDIWNNEIFFLQRETTAMIDVLAHVLDTFSQKNKTLSNMSFNDLRDYLNGNCEFNEIKVFDIKSDTYKQKLRLSMIHETVDFLSEVSTRFFSNNVIVSDSYSHYDFKTSFEDNLKHAINNYDEVHSLINEQSLKVFIKGHPDSDFQENVYIGRFLDCKSLCEKGFFLNINDIDERYYISILKTNHYNEELKLSLCVFDSEKKAFADEKIIQQVLEILKKPQ